MVSINYAFKEIISKIVYYGPGLSGKTTNLQYVFKKVPGDTRGELISLATDADRTLYFDFLPVNVGQIRGFSVKFQLYTVPGQVYYNATRKLVLRGVDGLVFVADSQVEKMDDNIESFQNLQENLAEYGYSLDELPLVLQYNKRDLPNIATLDQLNETLNHRGVPFFEAVASEGTGVFATLKAISKLVVDKAQRSGSEKKKPVVMSQIDHTEPKPQASTPPPVETPRVEKEKPKIETSKIGQPTAEAESELDSAATGHSVENAPSLNMPTVGSPSPKPEPVAVGGPGSSEKQSGAQPEKSVVLNGHSNTSEETESNENKTVSIDTEKPDIMKDSETMANVVVSTSEEPEPETEDNINGTQTENLEETTEHSVYREEEPEQEQSPKPERDPNGTRFTHPDVLDADKIAAMYGGKVNSSMRDTDSSETQDDAEISDPVETPNLLNKPQMAESKKVKGKKRGGLFGWLKKDKK